VIVVAVVPAVFVIVGLLVYMLAGNPKAVELGRLTFACGLLVLAYVLAGHVVRVG
jgi:Na+/phosphate symporter